MPSWHGYARTQELVAGTQVLFTGGREAVRLITGDRVVIETSESNRLSAVIIDRTGEVLVLGLSDGRMLTLHTVSDDGFADFKLSDGFSRESWVVAVD